MSLAQRVERLQPLPTETNETAAPTPRVAVPVDFRDITRRPAGAPPTPASAVTRVPAPFSAPLAPAVAPTPAVAMAAVRIAPAIVVSQAVAPVAAPHLTPPVRVESELALELLNEVSVALPILMGRCEELEMELATAARIAGEEVEAANELAREWQQIASALKLQVDGLEKGLRVMKQRAEAAELKASTLREETERSHHAAAEAECLSSLFQEKVISSFGSHSLMHPILEAFRSKGGTDGA